MTLKEKVLDRLLSSPCRGSALAREFNVSRTAVWKAIESLRAEGYEIHSMSCVGYRLTPTDTLGETKILHCLKTPWQVETLTETTSTNDVAKEAAQGGKSFFAVVADRQTAGRGRLKRAFVSPSGAGLYLSAVLKGDFDYTACGRITAYAAVAAARAVERLAPVKVDIKWVNDLYVGGKKLCGILTEGSLSIEGGALDYAVVGIGINLLKTAFPPEIAGKATSVENATGKRIDRSTLAAALLDELYRTEAEIKSGEFMNEYRARSCIIGRTVTVNGEYEATVTAIADDCSLILRRDGEEIKFLAGEVSVKP